MNVGRSRGFARRSVRQLSPGLGLRRQRLFRTLRTSGLPLGDHRVACRPIQIGQHQFRTVVERAVHGLQRLGLLGQFLGLVQVTGGQRVASFRDQRLGFGTVRLRCGHRFGRSLRGLRRLLLREHRIARRPAEIGQQQFGTIVERAIHRVERLRLLRQFLRLIKLPGLQRQPRPSQHLPGLPCVLGRLGRIGRTAIGCVFGRSLRPGPQIARGNGSLRHLIGRVALGTGRTANRAGDIGQHLLGPIVRGIVNRLEPGRCLRLDPRLDDQPFTQVLSRLGQERQRLSPLALRRRNIRRRVLRSSGSGDASLPAHRRHALFRTRRNLPVGHLHPHRRRHPRVTRRLVRTSTSTSTRTRLSERLLPRLLLELRQLLQQLGRVLFVGPPGHRDRPGQQGLLGRRVILTARRQLLRLGQQRQRLSTFTARRRLRPAGIAHRIRRLTPHHRPRQRGLLLASPRQISRQFRPFGLMQPTRVTPSGIALSGIQQGNRFGIPAAQIGRLPRRQPTPRRLHRTRSRSTRNPSPRHHRPRNHRFRRRRRAHQTRPHQPGRATAQPARHQQPRPARPCHGVRQRACQRSGERSLLLTLPLRLHDHPCHTASLPKAGEIRGGRVPGQTVITPHPYARSSDSTGDSPTQECPVSMPFTTKPTTDRPTATVRYDSEASVEEAVRDWNCVLRFQD